MLYLVSQFFNILWAFKLTKKIASYLVFSQLVVLLNLIGCLFLEQQNYHSHKASFYLIIFAFCFNFGAFIANLFFPQKKYIKINFYYKKKSSQDTNELLAYILSFLFFVVVSVFFFFLYGAPLFMPNVNVARVEFQKYFGANFFYRVFLYALPFTNLIFLFYWEIYKSKVAKMFFISSMIFVILELILLGFKGYVIWYSILLTMAFNIFNSNKKIIFIGGILLFLGVFAGVMITSKTYKLNMKEAFLTLVKRATLKNSFGYVITVYEFLEHGNLKEIPSKETFTVFLAKWKCGSDSFMSKTSRALTITIVGSLIVFTKFKGMIILALVFGFIFQCFYFLIFYYQNSPMLMSVFLFLTYSIVGIVNRGLTKDYFFQPILSLIILVLCYFGVVTFSKKIGLISFFYKSKDIW